MSRGQFTGDVLSSGIGNRNSSRVLAPPGGACSDIFGTGGPVTDYSKSDSHKARNDSSVFRSPVAVKTSEHTRVAAQRRNASQIFSDAPASPIRRGRASCTSNTSEDDNADAQTEEAAQPSKPESPMRRAAPKNSDIFGAPSEFGPASGKSRPVHTSSRVLAPPGGRSSFSFY